MKDYDNYLLHSNFAWYTPNFLIFPFCPSSKQKPSFLSPTTSSLNLIDPVHKRRSQVKPQPITIPLWALRCGTFILEERRMLPIQMTVRVKLTWREEIGQMQELLTFSLIRGAVRTREQHLWIIESSQDDQAGVTWPTELSSGCSLFVILFYQIINKALIQFHHLFSITLLFD